MNSLEKYEEIIAEYGSMEAYREAMNILHGNNESVTTTEKSNLMLSEVKQVKRFFGIKFGMGEKIEDGIYAVPTETSRGPAFMKMEIIDGEFGGKDNFHLWWDEQLTINWYKTEERPADLKESRFAILFRQIEECRFQEEPA